MKIKPAFDLFLPNVILFEIRFWCYAPFGAKNGESL